MTLPAKFVERVLRDLGGTEGAGLCAALDAAGIGAAEPCQDRGGHASRRT